MFILRHGVWAVVDRNKCTISTDRRLVPVRWVEVNKEDMDHPQVNMQACCAGEKASVTAHAGCVFSATLSIECVRLHPCFSGPHGMLDTGHDFVRVPGRGTQLRASCVWNVLGMWRREKCDKFVCMPPRPADAIILGRRSETRWLKCITRSRLVVKDKWQLGPTRLSPQREWDPAPFSQVVCNVERTTHEADPRHAEILRQQRGFAEEHVKGGSDPWRKERRVTPEC